MVKYGRPHYLRCPYCESIDFIRIEKEEVRLYDDGETVNDEFPSPNRWAEYTYECMKCHKVWDSTELK